MLQSSSEMPFFADSVDAGRAAASGRVGLMLQTHLPVETPRVAELSAWAVRVVQSWPQMEILKDKKVQL